MKGIVFTEFLEMVEKEFGLEVLDIIVDEDRLPSKGVYTAVGTYSFDEMLILIGNLSEQTKLPANDLLHAFGRYFFEVILNNYDYILKEYDTPISFLSSIDSHIHFQVRKIYPEAELPRFETLEQSNSKLKLRYTSSRGMAYFALGLMERTFEHFEEDYTLEMLPSSEALTNVLFDISI
ncbi:MAG: heme NO-binding domain-containing protein [Flavobacteriaceae bacterium]